MPTEKRSRKKAIREKCIDCCGGIRTEVRQCPATKCSLWPFRMGAEAKDSGWDVTTEELEVREAADDI